MRGDFPNDPNGRMGLFKTAYRLVPHLGMIRFPGDKAEHNLGLFLFL